MSIHKSLVPASKLRRHRNVLSRSERLEILKQDGRWDETRSVFGLAKVRNILVRAKAKKKEEAPAEGAAAAAPAAGAAPAAAGATPAKGAAATAPAKGTTVTPAKGAAAPPKKEEKKK